MELEPVKTLAERVQRRIESLRYGTRDAYDRSTADMLEALTARIAELESELKAIRSNAARAALKPTA